MEEWRMYFYFVPVEPNPPAPRTVASSSSDTMKFAVRNGAITICAIRSPGSIEASDVKWL